MQSHLVAFRLISITLSRLKGRTEGFCELSHVLRVVGLLRMAQAAETMEHDPYVVQNFTFERMLGSGEPKETRGRVRGAGEA